LVRDFDLIAIEDLAVKNMVRSAKGTTAARGVNVAAKRGLNRAISAQAWSRLRRRLSDKAATCGVTVVAVNPAHTSQRCAASGTPAPRTARTKRCSVAGPVGMRPTRT
jgi:putative transposase